MVISPSQAVKVHPKCINARIFNPTQVCVGVGVKGSLRITERFNAVIPTFNKSYCRDLTKILFGNQYEVLEFFVPEEGDQDYLFPDLPGNGEDEF